MLVEGITAVLRLDVMLALFVGAIGGVAGVVSAVHFALSDD